MATDTLRDEVAREALEAGRAASSLSDDAVAHALTIAAALVRERKGELLAANEADAEAATGRLDEGMLDRLRRGRSRTGSESRSGGSRWGPSARTSRRAPTSPSTWPGGADGELGGEASRHSSSGCALASRSRAAVRGRRRPPRARGDRCQPPRSRRRALREPLRPWGRDGARRPRRRGARQGNAGAEALELTRRPCGVEADHRDKLVLY